VVEGWATRVARLPRDLVCPCLRASVLAYFPYVPCLQPVRRS
jgi:hypothetical protein